MNDDYRLSHRAPGPEGDGTTVRLDQVGGCLLYTSDAADE